jgi:hypothetical protein
LDRSQGPFFRRGEGRVDEGFTEIDLPAIPQVFGEALQESIEPARSLPQLKATMAGLIRRIPRRQVVPRRARAQHPEHAVHHRARIGPRPTAAIGATARTEGRFEHGPLGIGQVHAVEYDGDPTDVSGRFRIYEIASSVPEPKFANILRAGHPGSLRCFSLKYSRYSRSARLAIRAPRPEYLSANFGFGTLKSPG